MCRLVERLRASARKKRGPAPHRPSIRNQQVAGSSPAASSSTKPAATIAYELRGRDYLARGRLMGYERRATVALRRVPRVQPWRRGIGPLGEEPALLLIDPYPWSAPLEEVRLKKEVSAHCR